MTEPNRRTVRASEIPRFTAPAARALLRWYRASARDLPWRRTRDAYAVWISETMLQQTRVETVLRYYEPFLARFPDVAALASAPEREVLARWSGLGYYRRARNLRHAARELVERFGGVVPSDAAALRTLPGVGRYTAGAIASIAFGRREPVLDGNVARVLARFFEVEGRWRSPALERQLWSIAKENVSREAPGDWNQSLMELGARICLPREPRCGECPLRGACGAERSGTAVRFPEPRDKPPSRRVRRVCVVLERGDRVLLRERRNGERLRGLWEFPGETLVDGEGARDAAARVAAAIGTAPVAPWGAPIAHTIMNERLTTSVFRAALADVSPPRRRGTRWFRWSEVESLPLSTVELQVLRRRGAELA